MTYKVRVTLRSGAVIKGITDMHPSMEIGESGNVVTIRLITKEWKDSRHIGVAVEDWDTIVNMADVTMVQCRQVTE